MSGKSPGIHTQFPTQKLHQPPLQPTQNPLTADQRQLRRRQFRQVRTSILKPPPLESRSNCGCQTPPATAVAQHRASGSPAADTSNLAETAPAAARPLDESKSALLTHTSRSGQVAHAGPLSGSRLIRATSMSPASSRWRRSRLMPLMVSRRACGWLRVKPARISAMRRASKFSSMPMRRIARSRSLVSASLHSAMRRLALHNGLTAKNNRK